MPTRAEAIVIVRYRTQVLVIRKKDERCWRFITAVPGRGDSLKVSCIRALQEETGLTVPERALLPYNVYYDTVKKMASAARRASSSVRFAYQVWQLRLPEIAPAEDVTEYRFAEPEELGCMEIEDSQKPVVKDLIKYGRNAARQRDSGIYNGD